MVDRDHVVKLPAREVMRAPMTFENTLFFHSNYPEMIAAILEIPCDAPLGFEKGSALDEIHNKFLYAKEFQAKAAQIFGRKTPKS